MISILNGEWEVEIISGPWWFQALRGNVKTIKDGEGYNTVCDDFIWGEFTAHQTFLDQPNNFTLIYANEPIIDKIQFIDENTLSGDFYWRNQKVGRFKMTRIIPTPQPQPKENRHADCNQSSLP